MHSTDLTAVHAIASLARVSGGPPQWVSDLCAALADCGTQTAIVTTSMLSAGGIVYVDPQKVKTIIVPGFCSTWLRIGWAPRFKHSLQACCEDLKAGILHNHSLWMHVNHDAAVVARQLKIPFIITPHGSLLPWTMQDKPMKKKWAMWLYQRGDLESARVLHVTSEIEAAEIRKLGLRNPLAVISNGIAVPEWQVPENGTEPYTALFLSRIHPSKGLMNLVRAWSIVRPKGWHMRIVGPDHKGHTRELQEAVRSAGLQHEFSFEPIVSADEKWGIFRKADLFIMPTFTENFGLAIAEALACGVPVITTKGAPWKTIQLRECGWWVDIGVEPLVSALREATEVSSAQRREMGLRGRRLVEELYDLRVIGAQMKSVYEWMIGGGPPPRCMVLD